MFQFHTTWVCEGVFIPAVGAAGAELIVIGEVAVTCGHPKDAAMVLVTVYAPGVLEDKFTSPALPNNKPVVDENVPATPPPLKVGVGFVALEQ